MHILNRVMKMKRKKWWTYGLFFLLTQAVGGISGLLTQQGMKQVNMLPKSMLTPPPVVFPIVWTILYTFMAVGAARVWLSPEGEERTKGLWLYVFQLIVNFFWSLLFFNMQAFGFSLLWLMFLWVLILDMTLTFRKVDKPAAGLVIPYLIWVAFAGYLNFVIWRLNR